MMRILIIILVGHYNNDGNLSPFLYPIAYDLLTHSSCILVEKDNVTKAYHSSLESLRDVSSPSEPPQIPLIYTLTRTICAKSLQSCRTLCDPTDCSPTDSSVLGFSGQQYQSGLTCSPPGDLPNPGDPICVSYVSCIGMQVLYQQHQLGSIL